MMFESRFGRLERLLHRLAFSPAFPHGALADMEDTAFGEAIQSVTPGPPVFISGLPRSGTTILLNLLTETGRFASHTYRDTPFVFSPLLWNRLSRRLAADGEARERAHADGITISPRSPEAFEEMIWKHFWSGHYGPDRIEPWASAEANQEFDEFFERHIRKIILLRQEDSEKDLRYVSKNNVNIARLSAPPQPLQRGIFLIPFRDPLQQAASMLLQHRRFSKLQQESRFARRYMEGIGHHDFGLGLRPIDFGGWMKRAPSPDTLEFWVRYWVAAYRHVGDHLSPSVHLVSYARLVKEPTATLSGLADVLGVPRGDLLPLAQRLHSPRVHEVGAGEVGSMLHAEAMAVFRQLGEGQQLAPGYAESPVALRWGSEL